MVSIVPPEFATKLQAVFSAIETSLTPWLERQRKQHEEFRRSVLEPLMRLYELQPTVSQYLNDRGWFVTLHFPLSALVPIEAHRREGCHDEVDAILAAFTRQHADATEAALHQRFPTRTHCFAQAFQAHRTGAFTLSVLGFLTQADGIGCEIINKDDNFFSRANNGRTGAIDQTLSAFQLRGQPFPIAGAYGEMIDPLKTTLSLEEGEKQRQARRQNEPWFSPLSRHEILHGLNLGYGTETQSLRCINLLQYLLDIDHILRTGIPRELQELEKISADI